MAPPNAEQDDPLDAASLILKSKDGETVRTSFGIVKQSATIGDATRARAETSDLNQPLEVQLDIKMLRAVIESCEFHRGKQLMSFKHQLIGTQHIQKVNRFLRIAAGLVTRQT